MAVLSWKWKTKTKLTICCHKKDLEIALRFHLPRIMEIKIRYSTNINLNYCNTDTKGRIEMYGYILKSCYFLA